MNGTLVDSNVLIDVLGASSTWTQWSEAALAEASDRGPLYINAVIYAEVSCGFERIEDLDAALDPALFSRLSVPFEAAFLAGRCFLRYRRLGGKRSSTLPDFFIGAHAAVTGLTLLTRDAARFRTYFPKVSIVAP